MSILVFALPIAIVLSLVRGGRLSALDTVPLRAVWLVVVGLGAQLGVVVAAGLGWVPVRWADSPVPILVGQAVVVTWLVLHRHTAGTGLVALGVLLNASDALALLLGGAGAALLPRATARAAGLELVLSPGDAVAGVGLVVLTHALLSHRPPAERRLAAALARTDPRTGPRAEARTAAGASTGPEGTSGTSVP